MAETLHFDLVSPERSLASKEVSEVSIPGADGDMTVMAGHAPTISGLRPGILRVVAGGETDEYLVSGGFAEINATGISVLAEKSLHRTDVTQEFFSEMVAEAKAAYEAAQGGQSGENLPGPVDEAAKLLSDMVALGDHIGLSAD